MCLTLNVNGCHKIETEYLFNVSVDTLQRCRVCSGLCAECVNSSSQCTACRDNQVLVDGTCLNVKEQCPPGKKNELI